MVDGVLQAVVSVLGDAVFMALAGIDAGGAEAIVVQQGGVIVVKSAAAAAAQFVGGSRGIVAAHHLWNAAQSPEGILQSLLQRQEGLTGGDFSVAPPRVAEYQLEQQVGVGLSGDGHLEFPAVGEVELGLPSRRMHLGEVHLLIRTMQRPPILQSSLQRPQLGCAEPARMLLLQPLDNCRCLQLTRRIIPQQRLNLILPHPVEGIGPSAPPMLRFRLRRQWPTLPLAR